ncbi:hypothetical protein NX059_007250 [Plenodomus lindquistii]|nr:hypothetical protein NX059_007250 [Plenodomus lindquistii]
MPSPTSLFSRARPGDPPPPKKIRGFMSLPGEIRNMIYAYYFAPSFRCEFAAAGFQLYDPKRLTVKLWSGLVHSKDRPYRYKTKDTSEQEQVVTIRISRPLGKYTTVKGLQTNWLASIYALNLVCKQIHMETTGFLYTKTTFFFDAPKRINAFLTTVPQTKLNLITKLQLDYNTYGDPRNTRDRTWQGKHLSSWSHACKSAAKKLVALKSLEIWVHIHDYAPKFNLREAWLAPLLQFRRLNAIAGASTGTSKLLTQDQGGLVDVKVHVQTPWSNRTASDWRGMQELADACTDLHVLFGQAIGLAIMGAKEGEAMAGFNEAWDGKYDMWKHHLQFAKTGW